MQILAVELIPQEIGRPQGLPFPETYLFNSSEKMSATETANPSSSFD